MNCRFCRQTLQHVFLDLGHAPPSNAYLERAALDAPETTFPLRLYVCDRCWLVQTQDYARPRDLFNANYAYFSSTSASWLAHANSYVEAMVARFMLTSNSRHVEVAPPTAGNSSKPTTGSTFPT